MYHQSGYPFRYNVPNATPENQAPVARRASNKLKVAPPNLAALGNGEARGLASDKRATKKKAWLVTSVPSQIVKQTTLGLDATVQVLESLGRHGTHTPCAGKVALTSVRQSHHP